MIVTTSSPWEWHTMAMNCSGKSAQSQLMWFYHLLVHWTLTKWSNKEQEKLPKNTIWFSSQHKHCPTHNPQIPQLWSRDQGPLLPPVLDSSWMSQILMSFDTALHISYTVRLATDTAVNASISTPVGPIVVTLASIPTEWVASWSLKLTSTPLSNKLWQKGTRFEVCFAPEIPAIFATVRTSPFDIELAATSAKAWGPRRTLPVATAILFVSVFSEMFTIAAFPDMSTCERCISGATMFSSSWMTLLTMSGLASNTDWILCWISEFGLGFFVPSCDGDASGAPNIDSSSCKMKNQSQGLVHTIGTGRKSSKFFYYVLLRAFRFTRQEPCGQLETTRIVLCIQSSLS